MRLSLTAALFALIAAPALAQDCRSIDNDLDRLACHDRESGRMAVSKPVPSRSAWQVRVETSDFDDTTSVYMRVDSDEPLRCGFGSPQRATIMLRCQENTTALFLSTGCHLTDIRSYGQVDIRLDSEPAFVSRMEASTDNRALGLWGGGQAIPLAKRMFGKDRMIMRFTPFSESPVTARFDISGLKDAIAPLRESCGW